MKQGCHKDLDAGLAIFLAELGELEGSLADTCLGGFVVNLVDVGRDSGDLGFDFSDELFHVFSVLVV